MKELLEIQKELKAPKNQRNKFGNYNYRSCEDILEAVKPLANKLGCSVLLSDHIIMVGDRIYVEATATLLGESQSISAKASAREPLSQKGMNEAQITGSASSYARKYALDGLFAIDDTKDADTNEYKQQTDNVSDNSKTISAIIKRYSNLKDGETKEDVLNKAKTKYKFSEKELDELELAKSL